MFINLYYGAKAPLVVGARQFDCPTAAEAAGSKSPNYYGTLEFKPKKMKFDLDKWMDLVEIDGTHKVVTRDGRDARILTDDRLSKKDYSVVALIMNPEGTKERVATSTPDGVFQIGEESPEDLFIVAV